MLFKPLFGYSIKKFENCIRGRDGIVGRDGIEKKRKNNERKNQGISFHNQENGHFLMDFYTSI